MALLKVGDYNQSGTPARTGDTETTEKGPDMNTRQKTNRELNRWAADYMAAQLYRDYCAAAAAGIYSDAELAALNRMQKNARAAMLRRASM